MEDIESRLKGRVAPRSAAWGLPGMLGQAPLVLLFLLGMWLVILGPMGDDLSRVPGDLGDARFNNYVLEHFYGWLSDPASNYWNAEFFYPYSGAMAFSDTLLGSAPLYALFRWLGLDFATSFQAWYIIGVALNFAAAGYVLSKLKLKPMAVGLGAFFFAFGLPMLAQENHAQLVYHFCVPLACYVLWRFSQAPHLRHLAILAGLVVWQFYLTIYMAIFLMLLLLALFILLTFSARPKGWMSRLAFWPRRLRQAWGCANHAERLGTALAFLGLGAAFMVYILPYYHAVRVYYFHRNLLEIFATLPRLKSYLLADNSQIWGSLSALITKVPARVEHQLFPGLGVLLLVLAGIVLKIRTKNSRIAWLHLRAALVLVVLTFVVNGISLYWLVWWLPGINSIRVVTRVMLVIMWPLALFAAYAVDGIIRQYLPYRRWLLIPLSLVAALLVAESVFYNHATYGKAEAAARLEQLRQQIPDQLPANPVLFVGRNPAEPFWATEIDAMLLSQQLGWPTMNGYSGNYPPGYTSAESCSQLPNRIKSYMEFSGISDPNYYLELIKRVVPIGFSDCDPSWWQKMP
jgi:hypothetical protein